MVDASVAVKWCLPLQDEPYVSQALLVIGEYRTGRLNLIAPSCFDYEIGHALVRAVRRERVTRQQADAAFRVFMGFGIALRHAADLVEAAWRQSHELGCSFYDASYLALADRHGAPFLHADARLRTVLAGRFPGELWIESFRPRRSAPA